MKGKMDTEPTIFKMETATKASGRMTYNMGKEWSASKMDKGMRGPGSKTKNMESSPTSVPRENNSRFGNGGTSKSR
jgi:hypothetical protein